MALPYEHPLWSTALGESLHPGGESLSRRLVELCSFRKGDHVLDAGCGPGVTLGILIEMGVDAVGLDTSCHFLEMAAERGPVVRESFCPSPSVMEAWTGRWPSVSSSCRMTLQGCSVNCRGS